MLCFVCHTNRPDRGVNGQYLEVLMHINNRAAIWEHPPGVNRHVAWLSEMGRVNTDDLIFMFANKRSDHWGIIAVGKAKAPRNGPIIPMQLHPSWYGTEWVAPVKWLVWNPANPCPFRARNASFYECDPTQTARIRQHFNV
jgi:hypothetical protein